MSNGPVQSGNSFIKPRPSDFTLAGHTLGVVKTAQQIPVPKGSSRAELVRAALVHDLGKLETGQEGDRPTHGAISAY